MRCPYCGSNDDKVVDSRASDEGASIRRRRECEGCGRRYTTYERVEELPLVVVKRSGEREPFERSKVLAGIRRAAKNRPLEPRQLEVVAADVEEIVRLQGPEVATEAVGLAILERLRELDEVTYLRFASVYKGFEHADDFARELGLLQKRTAPKGAPPPP